MKKTLVSVIVPIYGVEKYISRCAISLFEQSLEECEFIFVDDNSPDDSIKILNSIIDKYPNRKEQCVIVKHAENRGLPIARKTGIDIAKGDYLYHCDSDDWLEKTALENLYFKAVDDNADIVVADYYHKSSITDHGIYKKGIECETKDEFIKSVFGRKYTWGVWNKLVKHTLYTENNLVYPKDSMGEDMLLVMQLLIHAQVIVRLQMPVYNYFFNQDSITKVLKKDKVLTYFKQLKTNLDELIMIFQNYNLSQSLTSEIINEKYYVKSMLHPFLHDNNVKKTWNETYSDVTFFSLLKAGVDMNIILRYLCAKYNIYKTYNKIKSIHE